MGFVSNLCVGASTLAVASKTEDKEKKGMLSSFGVTGLCGVTEPAFYGCLISNEPARIGTMVGAACAGLFAGIFGLRTYVPGGCPGLLTFIFFIDNNGGFYYVMIAAITAVIAISVSYLFTCIRISYSHKKENRAEEKL
jgi:PTS system beta-glucosides-specific IIC component